METFNNMITEFHIDAIARAVLIMVVGFFISRLISAGAAKVLKKRLRAHQIMLIRRILFYFIFVLFFATAIQQLGFNISTLLGATGILTVAIGIASQTSMSNVVSGIFIIGEKPFEIGDTLKINDIQGDVISIDFLSVKIRMSNNTMVRIPNETLIKNPIVNLSYFPIRRVDLLLSIAYKENIGDIEEMLLAVAHENPLCLDEPGPSVTVADLGDLTVNIKLCAWGKTANYEKLKSALLAEIKTVFAKNNVETPPASWPLLAGSTNQPVTVKIISEQPKSL